ncbi:MAG: hypothetical protein IKN14_07755 [Clostridiales bacterium]|nr:hypothetical protein [Clostridiales bacterium]
MTKEKKTIASEEQLFNDCHTKRVLIITLALAFICEVFVFNFRFWESLTFSKISSDSYQIHQYDEYIEVTGIDAHIDNVYVDLFDADNAVSGDVVRFNLEIKDEGNAVYYPLQDTEVVYGIDQSSYIRVHTYGESPSIRFHILSKEGTWVLNDLKINEIRPFMLNPVRPMLIFAAGLIIILLGIRSPLYRRKTDLKESLQRSITIFIVLLNIILSGALWFISKYDTEQIKNVHTLRQYEYMADSIVHGKTYIDVEEPPVELSQTDNPYDPEERDIAVNGKSYIGDYAYYQGRYYSYFGVVPIILFFIPYLLITGKALATGNVIMLCLALFVPMVFRFMYVFTRKYFPNISSGMYLTLSHALLYGSEMLYCARIPTLYVVPIMTGMLFSLAGLTCWMKASDGKGHISKGYLAAGAVLIALVMGCRPQMTLIVFAAFPLFWNDIKERRFFSVRGAINTAIVFIPFIAVGAGLMFYNYIRFGSVFDFGATYNLTSFDMTHRGIVWDRMTTGLFAYLFQPLLIKGTFPFFFVFNPEETPLASAYQGVIISEPFMGGFFAFNLLALFIFLLPKVRKELKEKGLFGLCLLLTGLSLVLIFLDTQMVGMNQRYLCDFSFLLMIVSITVILALLEKYDSTDIGRLIEASVIALTFILVIINWGSLMCDGRYNPMIINSPQIYYDIKYGIFALR